MGEWADYWYGDAVFPEQIYPAVELLSKRHATGEFEQVGKLLSTFPNELLGEVERNVNFLFHAVEDEVRERKNGHRRG